MFELIVDNEVVLKLPELEDAGIMFALVDRNRDFLSLYLPWVSKYQSINDCKIFIEDCRKRFNAGSRFSLCIFEKNQMVGVISLRYIDSINKSAELEYWLSQDHQGKGLIHRSCIAVIKYIFEKLCFHRIEICCTVDNKASQHIPKRLGFTKDGVFRDATYLHGVFYNTIVYSLLSTDPLPE